MDVSSISSLGYLAAPAGSPTPQQAAERRQLLQAIKTVNESGELGRNQLVFIVDSQTHRPIIRVEDRQTHEVVLQIPPEYVLHLAEDMASRNDSVETTRARADT